MSRRSKINIDQVRELFENQGLSTYQVAGQLGCNQSHIFRLIKKYNVQNPTNPIKVRSKSEAQKRYMEENEHQRTGTSHSENSKIEISNKMKDFYESPDGDVAKQKIREVREEEWKNKSDDDKRAVVENLRVANREQMKLGKGSKFENFVAEELMLAGYQVAQREIGHVPGNMEVDIAIPQYAIAIEVDGPTHWSDIYGAVELQKVQTKDKVKDDALTVAGWDVVRIQDGSGSTTRARIIRILELLKTVVKTRKTSNSKTGKVYVIKP